MIAVRCRHCGEGFDVPDSLAGQEERCPKCGSSVRVEEPMEGVPIYRPDRQSAAAAPPNPSAQQAVVPPPQEPVWQRHRPPRYVVLLVFMYVSIVGAGLSALVGFGIALVLALSDAPLVAAGMPIVSGLGIAAGLAFQAALIHAIRDACRSLHGLQGWKPRGMGSGG